MLTNENYINLTHNQVVPGSSPGGTTDKTLPFEGFFCYFSSLRSC